MSRGAEANRGDIVLMVGTRKGAFLLTSDHARRNWAVSGPHHAGSDVFHLAYDGRGERDGLRRHQQSGCGLERAHPRRPTVSNLLGPHICAIMSP